ncbi:MAG TPA: mechanosensitive ion channel family protein [Anaerolineae bacterium]|nr:mechanosensitive ion channel family protein [Anaerolineae bacterium]
MEGISINWGTLLKPEYGWRILGLAITWGIVWLLVRYFSRVLERLDQRIKGIDIDTREMETLDKLLDYLVIAIGMLVTIAILNLTSVLYSILTAAGVITIVIGFAIRDVAANFISGIFILLDQPFVRGDSVKIGDFSGTVRRISLRSTEIVTFDGPVVSMPNSTVATTPIVNYSINKERRVNLTVAISQETDLRAAIETLRELAEKEERRIPEKDISLFVSDVRDGAIVLTVMFYTPAALWGTVTNDLRQSIVEEFNRRGLELAVPVYKSYNVTVNAQTQPKTNKGG